MRRSAVVRVTLFSALALLLAAALWMFWLRPERDAALVAAHPLPPAVEGPQTLTATWFGTTAILLRAGDDAVMIDPFFTRPRGVWPLVRNAEVAPDEPLIARWLKQAGVTHLSAVLVSHSHFDHAMDAGVVARLTGAVLMGSESTANIGRGAGLPNARIRVIQPGQAEQLGAYRITFFASRHAGATGGAPTGDIDAPLVPPAHYMDYRQGGTFSILVQHPRGSVLHHGSAGFVHDALRGVHADTVLLGAALVEQPQAYVREVVETVGAHRVVPVHWDNFLRGLDEPIRPMPVVVDLDSLYRVLRERPGLQIGFPVLGQPFAVN